LKMKLFQKFLTLTISLVIAIPISFSVSAQDSTPTLGIEEIIVTARKKDESIQTFQWRLLLLQSNFVKAVFEE